MLNAETLRFFFSLQLGVARWPNLISAKLHEISRMVLPTFCYKNEKFFISVGPGFEVFISDSETKTFERQLRK